MPANHSRGGVLAAVLVGFLLFGVLVLVGVVSAGLYFARNVRVTERDDRGVTTVETPLGSLRVRQNSKLEPRHMGVPVYPGAERAEVGGHAASIELDLGDAHKGLNIVAAEYTTSDPVDKVAEFYRHELPHWLIREKSNGCFQIELKEGGYRKIIAIRQKHGLTHIGLASVGEPASN